MTQQFSFNVVIIKNEEINSTLRLHQESEIIHHNKKDGRSVDSTINQLRI